MKCWEWPPPRRDYPLAVAIPGSLLAVEHTLLLKTVKAGLVGRLLAVYRVDYVAVYSDPDTREEDSRLLELLLKYQATPPHLKRKLFPLMSELRHAGVMPPLKIPSHTPPGEPKQGDVMYGLVEGCSRRACRVYLGGAGYGVAGPGAKPGDVVLVRIVDRGPPLTLEYVREEEVGWYLGFRVERFRGVGDVVEAFRRRGFNIIATSKYGRCASRIDVEGPTLLVFGGPWRGLLEFSDPAIYDDVVNIVHMQGTETVRTEEALAAALALASTCRAQ